MANKGQSNQLTRGAGNQLRGIVPQIPFRDTEAEQFRGPAPDIS